MKKLSLGLIVVFCSVVLIWCGWNTWGTASTSGGSNWVAVNSAANVWEGTEVVVANNWEVAAPEAVELAQCIKESWLKMYGTERCGHCKNQKKLFGDAFTHIDYTDCDADKTACVNAGVRGFPTWVDSDGNAYPGTQQLDKLASIAWCEG